MLCQAKVLMLECPPKKPKAWSHTVVKKLVRYSIKFGMTPINEKAVRNYNKEFSKLEKFPNLTASRKPLATV